MRAPQLGHSEHKRRKRRSNAALPAMPKAGLTRAVGLYGPNQPYVSGVRYLPPKQVLYCDGTLGAPVTLHLNHKSATWEDGVKVGNEGPIVTKRYEPIKTTHRQRD